jgi:hypothetical protein
MAEVKVGEFKAHDADGTAERIVVFRKLIDTTDSRHGHETSLSKLATLRTADGLDVIPIDSLTYGVVGMGRILYAEFDPGIEKMRQEQP